jgi:hypothetical protein
MKQSQEDRIQMGDHRGVVAPGVGGGDDLLHGAENTEESLRIFFEKGFRSRILKAFKVEKKVGNWSGIGRSGRKLRLMLRLLVAAARRRGTWSSMS